ncbi:ER degradation-enhancing alpha-mannosidase-like protein 2 [Macrosteles quadrilineatus]|uniref:ER degradation-enhancing alpha-mannosidase-like protein 2 n=1 Tax=Macrosteles quadrilineatus TaxID=74068 RepID=UPI0023E1D75C|nr:ER degradation-enhancing alpha-mannosidase-like protein 2 [Macrosteles quadrilineatus]
MSVLKWLVFQLHLIVIFLTVIKPNLGYGGRKYTKDDLIKLREEVREMFNHAYSGYLKYAYPYDELRPLTCDGVDTWGSYSLTLIDALDTLAVMGNYTEFRRVVDIVVSNANFDANINVSVFETNIRIVGGLLSAHLLSQRAGVDLEPGWPCNGPLLRLAEDVARRLIAAFDTTTGMPYGTVNLRHGVPPGETSVTCTAAVGTFILEFGTLSRLTGDPLYEEVAMNALHALYNHRSSIGLYGNHIDVMTGRWTAQDSGIGAGVDSYLEYLVKGALLVQKPELMAIFNEGRVAIDKYLKHNDWYLWVSMHKGQVTLPVFQSLEAYWPGVLSLIGDISGGMKSLHNYHQVWKQYGFTPEFYNIAQGQVGTNREAYPLRPELIESTMYLYRATKDPFLLDVGLDILRSIQHSSRTKCGYATVKDVRDHSLENRMESFFLSETTKYLYLLFDPDNFIHNNGQQGSVHTLPSGRECILDAGGYIFNTEAHPIDPGALLCCSDNSEPKRYNREAARGEKLSSFAKFNQMKEPPSVPQSTSGNDRQEVEDLPSAFTDDEPVIEKGDAYFKKLKKNRAVDIVTIPPPNPGEVQPIVDGKQKRLSLNMLQMIETLINNNLDKHLKRTAWSHDLLKELVDVIEHAEEILSRKKRGLDGKEVIEDNKVSAESKEEDSESVKEKVAKDRNASSDSSKDINEEGEHIANSSHRNKIVNKGETELFEGSEDSEESTRTNEEKKEKGLFELVMRQQFNNIKKAVLAEAELMMLHLTKCLENLELTKSLDEVIDSPEIRIQFHTQRLEVTVLANNMKRSLEETKKLLNQEGEDQSVTMELFKRLIELVVDGKTVKTFLDDYKQFMDITKKIIEIEKEKYNLEDKNENESSDKESTSIENNNLVKGNIETLSVEENTISNTDKDAVENDNKENSYISDEGKLLHNDNWKADDISYQVDDKDRNELSSKSNDRPLFTDKLKIKTETVVGLLPKSLVSSDSNFDPQVLLERIRNNPKYYRNSTWPMQYDLLTCLPQSYFIKIMLSGEFFSD